MRSTVRLKEYWRPISNTIYTDISESESTSHNNLCKTRDRIHKKIISDNIDKDLKNSDWRRVSLICGSVAGLQTIYSKHWFFRRKCQYFCIKFECRTHVTRRCSDCCAARVCQTPRVGVARGQWGLTAYVSASVWAIYHRLGAIGHLSITLRPKHSCSDIK